jgi:hypothetical protein
MVDETIDRRQGHGLIREDFPIRRTVVRRDGAEVVAARWSSAE